MAEISIGSTWLKEHFKLLNFRLSHKSFLGIRSKVEIQQDGTVIEFYQMNYALREDSPLNHFEFSLKYDDIQPDFFKSVLSAISVDEIVAYIESAPTGKYSRKIGFWYEFLMGQKLPVEDRQNVSYVDLLDSKLYFTGKNIKNFRWRINDNLLGNNNFCPIIKNIEQGK